MLKSYIEIKFWRNFMKLVYKLINISFLVISLIFATYAYAESNASPSDREINSSVHEKIAKNPTLAHYNINVIINNGVASLSGVVNSDKDAGILIAETQSASGVKDVMITKLKIKNKQHPFKDTVITAKIKGKLIEKEIFSEKNVEAMDTHVSTKNGIVTLSGRVENQERANNAIAIAKSVKGVKEVKSNIKTEN